MKKLILASAVVAAFSGSFAQAQEAAAPEHQFAFNVGATSDYRFRGISQSRLKPAVFAGADYTHTPTGFYAGSWASTIKWIKDSGASDGAYEIDFYGGKRGEVGGVSYDAGVITYQYPGNTLGNVSGFANANTTEAYIQFGYGPAYVKYNHALTNFVGNIDSKGSNYIDLGANIDVTDGYILNLHYGMQKVKNGPAYDYSDWKIGVTKDFGLVVAAVAVVGTDASKTAYDFGGRGYLGKTGAVLTLTKNF
jgi:uncharacterized protein (TIGR02001 family)